MWSKPGYLKKQKNRQYKTKYKKYNFWQLDY